MVAALVNGPRLPLPPGSGHAHRGVHAHTRLPRAAVPGVGGRGRCGMAGGPQDGGLPDRGKSRRPIRGEGVEQAVEVLLRRRLNVNKVTLEL